MSIEPDDQIARRFAARCEETRAVLRGHMAAQGLYEIDGWRIHEFTRHRDGVTELVMCPIHMRLASPVHLECIVTIDEPGERIDSECQVGS